jgi:hypothetical protein
MDTIRFPTEFKEFLKLLNSAKVDYLVVGGYAMGFHGHPRATGDLDVWIATSPPNVSRVRAVLIEFGFSNEIVAGAPLEVADRIIRMGMPPLRIELLTGLSGVQFEDCFRRRQTDLVDGFEVSFISRMDLLTNKRAAARSQDLADVSRLSRTSRKQPDKSEGSP